jgi:hypothetical protein
MKMNTEVSMTRLIESSGDSSKSVHPIENPEQERKGSFDLQEWKSPDGKRVIDVTTCITSCENKSDDFFTRKLSLYTLSKNSSSPILMMAAQEKRKLNETEKEYAITLGVFEGQEENILHNLRMRQVVYSSENGGELSPPNASSTINLNRDGLTAQLTEQEFRKKFILEMKKEGICDESELPQKINVEATVQAFLAQIGRQDFSKPALVSQKQPLPDFPSLEELGFLPSAPQT